MIHVKKKRNFFIAYATIISGIGTIKFYMPVLSIWFIITGFIAAAFFSEIKQYAIKIKYIDRRIFFPWVFLIFSIALSAFYNKNTIDFVFSGVTIVKLIVITVVFALLIPMELSIKELESFFVLSMMIGIGGFAVAMLNSDWVMRYGDGRLAWTWAWAGVFWKIGAYVFPFLAYQVLQKPSWFKMPALMLAATIIALDGSRTGLLVISAIIVTAVIYIKFFRLNASWMSLIICIASIIMAYAFIHPMISLSITLGGISLITGFLAICLFLVSVYFQFRNKNHISAKFMGAGILILISIFCVKKYDQSVFLQEIFLGKENILAYQRIAGGDSTRIDMFLHGIQSSIANFPLGGGLGSTTLESYGYPLHIHMTYLQLFSDLGLIGILSYMAIFLLSILWFFRLKDKARISALPVLATILIYFIQGCFAPFSNEITEWFPVILSFSVLYNLYNSGSRKYKS